MKIEQSELIKELRDLTKQASAQVSEFKLYTAEQLNFKPSASQWSILECIEHLCLYGKFYLPEIENRITNVEPVNNPPFKSGVLGNYFVGMIKASNTKKITATKQMDSTGSELNMSSINQFLKQLEWLDSLLIKAEKTNLTKIKTAISLSKMVKLRLGDTLRFLVYHNERHILQATQINLKPATKKAETL